MIKIWSILYRLIRHRENGVRETSTPEALAEARSARVASERDLRKVRGQRAEVERVADALRDATVQDRLTEMFAQTIKPRPKRGRGTT